MKHFSLFLNLKYKTECHDFSSHPTLKIHPIVHIYETHADKNKQQNLSLFFLHFTFFFFVNDCDFNSLFYFNEINFHEIFLALITTHLLLMLFSFVVSAFCIINNLGLHRFYVNNILRVETISSFISEECDWKKNSKMLCITVATVVKLFRF